MNCSQVLTLREACAFISQFYKPSPCGVFPHWASFSKWILLLFIFILVLCLWATIWGFTSFILFLLFPHVSLLQSQVIFRNVVTLITWFFRDFWLPIFLNLLIEKTLLLNVLVVFSLTFVSGEGWEGAGQAYKKVLKKHLPRWLSAWFVVGFLKGLLHGSRGADSKMCLSLRIPCFSGVLREHLKCVNSALAVLQWNFVSCIILVLRKSL